MKLYQIFNIFKKKMIVIATLFWKLQTVNDLVRRLSKKHRLRAPFDRPHVKGSQTLVKSGSLRVAKKYDESALMKILREFGTL